MQETDIAALRQAAQDSKTRHVLWRSDTLIALLDRLEQAEKDAKELAIDAALGRTAMKFVDRAGDVHPGIDDAETICAEFHDAMAKTLDAAMQGEGN